MTTSLTVSSKDRVAIRSGLRQAFRQSEYKKKFLSKFKELVPRLTKSGKPHKIPYVKYKCQECEELFNDKDINVDHVEKVGAFKDVQDIKEFFFRIWCHYDNLQVLCISCHADKTVEEKLIDKAKKVKAHKVDDEKYVKAVKAIPKPIHIITDTGRKFCGLPVFTDNDLEENEVTLHNVKKSTTRYINLDDCEVATDVYIQSQLHKHVSAGMIIGSIHCASINSLGISVEPEITIEYSEEPPVIPDVPAFDINALV